MADGMDYQHQRQRSGTASQRSVRVEAPMEPVEPVPSVPSIHQIPPSSSGTAVTDQEKIDMESKPLETTFSPDPQVAPAMRKFRQKRTKSIDLDDYFEGPRAIDKHSKWPMFLRMHGSIFPELVLPVFSCGLWATLITCISQFVYPLGVSNILLTVLGFVVSLAISLRSTTSYERYSEGRKYWAQLMLVSQTLAREIWVSASEAEGEEGKEDVLGKLTGLNLIVAFANALKHKLRFEPYVHYEDLQGLVQHLDTYAKEAEDPDLLIPPKKSPWKVFGEYLGVPMAESNPRKQLKRAKKPLGNLPLEILNHLSRYVDTLTEAPEGGEAKLKGYHQVQATQAIFQLNDVLAGTERVLTTPLPIAYTIAISQIAWLYVLLLPFQLWESLQWVTIPGTIAAAYIILGFEAIGREIENPFGNDVNDLPLDDYCNQLAAEIDIIASTPAPKPEQFIKRQDNLVLFPFSPNGYGAWAARSVGQIRERLRSRPFQTMSEAEDARKSMHESRQKKKQEV
ncbi:Bestrophin/UPF0187 [Lasiodiplodia theobromae]|uniref:UPF0187 protein n=2 Tax=Lasiodiplodia TaxID=66739 RepID=A0AA39YTM6_9PEZI|nr:uncharacterized protein LTHEOB_10319 [Lasiodiplodia theobromae]KAB2578012.1 putative membrane protein [Lasiodiplodia theobromae]KAF4539387.1 hypothetical protein LTHEOB_10319 [Lasiodiplodia theobromae]KAF9638417.1 Bestrophin/UPF0187 [Lasiodiplodia theobromae]KAK0658427.1 UPF0187 protein [Lasiodiplodia hormozganensis]